MSQPTTNEGCSAEILTDPNDSPMVFEISFDALKFTKNGIEKFIWLSFASPYRHKTSQAVHTNLIGIETKPTLLKFTQEPPEVVAINEVFEIRVEP